MELIDVVTGLELCANSPEDFLGEPSSAGGTVQTWNVDSRWHFRRYFTPTGVELLWMPADKSDITGYGGVLIKHTAAGTTVITSVVDRANQVTYHTVWNDASGNLTCILDRCLAVWSASKYCAIEIRDEPFCPHKADRLVRMLPDKALDALALVVA